MGNSQLFQFGRELIEAKYCRGSRWADSQLTRAIELADAAPLTPTAMQEILQYEFGIQWDGEVKH